jgi:cysteinyl-tRNA synthetase
MPADLQDGEQEKLDGIRAHIAKFENAMEDDFNTASALSAIFELIKDANINVQSTSSTKLRDAYIKAIDSLCGVMGIIPLKKEEMLDDEIAALIEERNAARKAKNFARADEIRDTLAAKGITLKDTREGTKWSRT